MSSHQNKSKKKRKGTIAGRVTLWYAIPTILLTMGVFILMYLYTQNYILSSTKENLLNSVVNSESVFLNDGEFDAYDDGIYLSRYSSVGVLLEGNVPIPTDNSLSDKEFKEIQVNEKHYIYYEHYNAELKQWFRGIVSLDRNDLIVERLFLFIVFVLPLFFIIMLLGGYILIRLALKPLRIMLGTVYEIQNSVNLSRRITIGDGNDELYRFGNALNSMLERVEEAYERQKQFNSDISHELRTPLSIILSESEYGLDKSANTEMENTFSVIKRQSKYMKDLINKMLEMARLDSTIHIEKERLNISSIITEMLEDFRLLTEDRNMELSEEIDEGIYIDGDVSLIKRMMDNLLSNALKFGENKIKATLKSTENQAVLKIENDGAGIPREKLSKIWNRLYQDDESRNSKKEGLGLGLYFVKKIVLLHGGEIHAESEAEKTTFEIKFPLHSS